MSNISSPQELADELYRDTKSVYERLSPSETVGKDETSNADELASLRNENAVLRANTEFISDLLDDTLSEFDAYVTKVENRKASTPVKQSRIRVWLSRPLSYAEVEHLTTDHSDPNLGRINDNGRPLSLRVASNREHVWVDGALSSRVLYELVAAALETHFVNVYPKAVRTFTEYNGQ